MRPSLFQIAFIGLLLAVLAGCGAPGRAAGPSGAIPNETIELRWEDLSAGSALGSRAAPLGLTASDGTGIELVSLKARAAVEDPLAFTELSLIFENPSDRVLEGTFSVTLPATASVHRFAMLIGGVMQEGEIVERRKAEQTFEAFMHRNVDPALLEQQPGNQFRARVFPIAAKEQKEIVLGYSELLEKSDEPYRLYLSGLPTLDELDIRVSVAGKERHRLWHLESELLTPDRDFVLPEAARSGGPALARAGNYAVARVKTPSTRTPDPIDELTIALDTSASRAVGLRDQVGDLGRLLSSLSTRGNPGVKVLAFDQDVSQVYSGPASGFRETHAGSILARGAGGATDVGRVLQSLRGQRSKRLLLLSDAIFTSGTSAWSDLAQSAGLERLDVALAGATRDRRAAARVAAAGTRPGTLLDGPPGSDKALEQLLSRGSSTLKIRVLGSRFSFPEQLSASEAGGEAIVFAELTGEAPFEVQLNETRHALPSTWKASQALVERALARARIAKLLSDHEATTDDAIKNRIQRRVVSLSRKHKVLSPFTSLLVLESEDDYARFGIDRTAPHEFMAVGEDGGVTIVGRARGALPEDGSRGGVSGTVPVGRGTDRDRDAIADQMDRCPDRPEIFNGFEDQDGCPDKGRIVVESSNIIILDSIQFEAGTATIRAVSQPIVDAIVATLKSAPDLRLIEIAGYTDSHGNPAHNQRLSELRAQAVYHALVRAGIQPARLVARGYGQRCPRDVNTTQEGRDKNRRVEFKVLETTDGQTGVETCAREPFSRSRGFNPLEPGAPIPPPPESLRPARPDAVEGELARIRGLLAKGNAGEALRAAGAYRDQKPGDELAWVALGDVLLHKGELGSAARAYGSLIDLAGDSAAKHRAAAGFLEAVERRAHGKDPKVAADALALASDAYQKALERRRDHPSSHELYAYALAKQGKLEEAFEVLARGVKTRFDARFTNAKSWLSADLGLIAAAWAQRAPSKKDDIARRLRELGVPFATGQSVRLILTWETDTSDVNLEVTVGGKTTFSGGNGNNVRDGFGPEHIALPAGGNAPFRVGVSYDRRGFQGYALGKVLIVRHDGSGGLAFDDRPFVLMKEHGYADLGELRAP